MSESLLLEDFLKCNSEYVIIDVRSPAEFYKGHIPGAVNLPFLDDEERKIIGTIFKQKGREEAVIKGFELIGPKFAEFIKSAMNLAKNKIIRVYCWRGGLRSNISAWILQTAGFKVYLLNKGYKSFRNFVLQNIHYEGKMKVVGGMTGTGKTLVLYELESQGHQVLDIEKIACHKGSAFGALGQDEQPTDEQFTNILGMKLSTFDPEKTLWVENESRCIVKLKIPDFFFERIRNADVLEIHLSNELRIKYLISEYTRFPLDELIDCTRKLTKKLGGLRTQIAIQHLLDTNFYEWVNMMIEYYDENYNYSNFKRDQTKIVKLYFEDFNIKEIAKTIITYNVLNVH